jgi:hypothetical protein
MSASVSPVGFGTVCARAVPDEQPMISAASKERIEIAARNDFLPALGVRAATIAEPTGIVSLLEVGPPKPASRGPLTSGRANGQASRRVKVVAEKRPDRRGHSLSVRMAIFGDIPPVHPVERGRQVWSELAVGNIASCWSKVAHGRCYLLFSAGVAPAAGLGIIEFIIFNAASSSVSSMPPSWLASTISKRPGAARGRKSPRSSSF